ncbi:MAG TPA: hypothetical protein VGG48_07575 [Rhizomicrobium sp.]|jgi:hypothetical protein
MMRTATYLLIALNVAAWGWLIVLLLHPRLSGGFDLNPNKELLSLVLLGLVASLIFPLWSLRKDRAPVAASIGGLTFIFSVAIYLFEGFPPPPFFF